jgi:hypothetical protein
MLMNRRIISSLPLSPRAIATRPLLLILFAANLLAGASALKAGVLFSQGSPSGDEPLFPSNGPNSGAIPTAKGEAADFFVLPSAGTPSTLQWFGNVRVGAPLGSGEPFLLRLYSNSPRGPGALLYEESIDVIGTAAGSAGRSYSAPFAPGDLAAGKAYWVSIVENDPSASDLGWQWGEFVIPGHSMADGSGESGTWLFLLGDEAVDFTLLGSVAPEPDSGILLGIGALALAAVKTRKRHFRRSL